MHLSGLVKLKKKQEEEANREEGVVTVVRDGGAPEVPDTGIHRCVALPGSSCSHFIIQA